MRPRCVELRRVLKKTGSFYYHCDDHASHYVKQMLDQIFGQNQFLNEIIWKRTGARSDAKRWNQLHDTLLVYTGGGEYAWNPQFEEYSEDYVATKYRFTDPDGRIYRLDNMTSPNPRPNMMYEWKGFPSPAKAAEFQAIDRVAGLGAIDAARQAGVQHFIYLSVAQPAPMMKSYIAVRAECEAALRNSGMNTTVVRPWYVLGPGHRWPYVLLPMYWLCERIPSTRDGARRLGLVTLDQMISLLVSAVENPSVGARFVEVPQIRTGSVLP